MMGFSIRKVLLVFLVLEVSAAIGVDALPCDVRVGQFADVNSLVEKVAIIGEPGQTDPSQIKDDRRTSAEYAADHNMTKEEVEKKYAGTGQLDCSDGSVSTANLVVKNNIVLAVAHAFYDRKTCNLLVDPSECHFTVKVGKKKETIGVSKVVAKNFNCPGSINQSDELMALELTKSVSLAEPYKVANDSDSTWSAGAPLTMVASNSMDFFPPDERRPLNEIKSARKLGYRTNFPKHYGDCQALGGSMKNVVTGREKYDLSCDGDKGASGGGIFARSPSALQAPELRGVLIAGPTYAKSDEVETTGRPVAKPARSMGVWSTLGIAINGPVKRYLDSLNVSD